MKIDITRKLSSRKFWAMLAGQVTAIATALGAGENTVLRTGAIIASVGTIIVYMLAESYVDGKRAGGGEDT